MKVKVFRSHILPFNTSAGKTNISIHQLYHMPTITNHISKSVVNWRWYPLMNRCHQWLYGVLILAVVVHKHFNRKSTANGMLFILSKGSQKERKKCNFSKHSFLTQLNRRKLRWSAAVIIQMSIQEDNYTEVSNVQKECIDWNWIEIHLYRRGRERDVDKDRLYLFIKWI